MAEQEPSAPYSRFELDFVEIDAIDEPLHPKWSSSNNNDRIVMFDVVGSTWMQGPINSDITGKQTAVIYRSFFKNQW